MARPDRIRRNDPWQDGRGEDPAKYLIHPGDVRQPGKHRPGNLRHARPYIVNGSQMYVFPIGTEGFRRSGQATLGLHHHIGGHYVIGRAMHRDEARIELRGTLPGVTAKQNMIECITMLTSIAPREGMHLYVPGVFGQVQNVLPESWDFNHDPEDRTHSIDFTITFVRSSTGKKVTDPHGAEPPPQPGVKKAHRGNPARVFIVQEGYRTFQAIAAFKYHNSGQWLKLANQNQTLVRRAHIPLHKVPTHRWPLGTKIHW